MHISHVQSVQVYASPSFDAVSAWWQAFLSWDFACVLCARDVVTEMAVALHAIGVKCDVHHVAGKDAQRFLKHGLSAAQERAEQHTALLAATAGSSLSAAASATQERMLDMVLVAVQ